tara:strand:- start:21 stop:608 length:588 start_codon:yes stop_codon:yes gene_type:complete
MGREFYSDIKIAQQHKTGVTVEVKGIKEIMDMFQGLPKRVNKDAVWGKFWKKVSVPLLEAAEKEAPFLNPGSTGRVGVSYPADTELTISRGTLKKSLKFYRTRASKGDDIHGAYIGPRVKGKFKKNKGGYFGAWVEYGHKNRDGSMSKPNDFMMRAWNQKSNTVLASGFTDAEKIFVKAVAADVRRMRKYGSLGY